MRSQVDQSRAELAESIALGLAGSLNVRRTALRLLTQIQPELADWALLVVPSSRPGEVALFGGVEAWTTIVTREAVTGPSLDRVLLTGRTELVAVQPGIDVDTQLATLLADKALRARIATVDPAAVLAVGLTGRGATLGALLLARGGSRRFDADDVAFVERIGVHAAFALDSARMYEEQGRVADVLKRSLRPPALPVIDGVRLAARYRPAAEHLDIGGDFYDVHGFADDWVLALGDVCGKGIEVAALTGRTRQSIRTAAHFDRNPAPILRALNHVLYDAGPAPFVTVLCARIRPRADGGGVVVDVAAAGHPAPILLRASGGVEQIRVSGTAAGLLPDATYQSARATLRRGDTMLMFTDGIDEARGRAGLYGVDRLIALLPAYAGADPDAVCDAVERDVIEFLDNCPHDDIALLAVTCGAE